MHSYFVEQAVHYQFLSPGFSHHFEIDQICSLSLEDRKKLILFFYFLLHLAQEEPTYDEWKKKAASTTERIPSALSEEILSWEQFKKRYQELQVQSLPFIGYGSLLNKNDLRRTLPGERSFTPVIAFGAKRLFKYRMECDQSELNEIAALGLDPCYDREHHFNGVLFDLKEEEVDALAEREEKYLLRKLPYIDSDEVIKEAYSLIFPQDAGVTLKPSLNYLYLILSGNRDDLAFIRFFCETSYLADGITSVSTWIENEANRIPR